MSTQEERTAPFRRNPALERLLKDLNDRLRPAEEALLEPGQPAYPLLFVVGPLRSGTTLMMQWLAGTGVIACPTNLLSRFYGAPVIGAKIQLLLTDERYDFRGELKGLAGKPDFRSENGKTRGVLAPNEFWYFWRRFLPFGELDYLPTEELLERADTDTLRAELAGIAAVFRKPLALKALILNYNLDFLDRLFEKAVFIHMKRDPLAAIASALAARQKQLGGIDRWYSFKIPEYPELIKRNPYEQVAGQVYYTQKAVAAGLAGVTPAKQLTVSYEEFCRDPGSTYQALVQKLSSLGFPLKTPYAGPAGFKISRRRVTDGKILKAYRKFFADKGAV